MSDTHDTTPSPTVWPCYHYDDAHAAIRFLVEAFGFETRIVVPGGEGDREVVHAELVWPLGGGVMLGSKVATEGVGDDVRAGTGWAYAVCDDPDALLARAKGMGAEVVQDIKDEEYGSRGFTVRDPEGNLWSFGTYRGAPRA